MSIYPRLHTLNVLLDTGLVPLFYHPDAETARRIVEACHTGGAKVIEFTNRGDFALDVFREVRRASEHVILGVGTVIDAPTAALCIAYGADFIVSPVFSEEVARLCNRRKIPYFPGCATPTEIATAEEWGVEVVKLFPGSMFTPDYVRAIRAPSPWTRIMPTGGVEPNEASISAWFKAGVSAVGMGSQLIKEALVKNRDFEAIRDHCAQVLTWIKQQRD